MNRNEISSEGMILTQNAEGNIVVAFYNSPMPYDEIAKLKNFLECNKFLFGEVFSISTAYGDVVGKTTNADGANELFLSKIASLAD